MVNRSAEYLIGLVQELRKLPSETEWAEFKANKYTPQDIGEYVSALANSAALSGKPHAYLVWGIADHDHAVVGTRFDPSARKVGNEELESWLLRLLAPKINFRFSKVSVEGHSVVLLEIERASRHPVQFRGEEYIRVGSYKKKLKDFPEKERALWRIFDQTPFENGIVAERVSDDYVTNTSIRQRFGIEVRNSAKASRLIAESVEQGVIAPDDPTSAPKLMRYVPWWAKGEARAVT